MISTHLSGFVNRATAICAVLLLTTPTYAASPDVLSLEEAIDKAIRYSPGLAATAADIDAAKGAEEQAGYRPNPELIIDAEDFGGTGEFSGVDGAELTVGISQTIENTAKREQRLKAASAERVVQENNVPLVKLDLIRNVRLAYIQTLAAHHQVILATEEQKLAKTILKNVTKRVSAARDPLVQQEKAKIRYANSQLRLENTLRDWEAAKAILANFWDAESLPQELQHSLFTQPEKPQSWQYYISKVDNQTPDLKPFDALIDSRQAALSYEQVALKPDLGVTLGVRDNRGNGDQAFVLGLSIPLPVLNTNQGNIRQASANLAKVSSSRLLAEQQLKAQLQENWQRWQAADTAIERLQTTILPSAETALTLSQAGYNRGKFSYLEVLDAQRTLFDSKSNYYDALLRAHIARTNIDRLTGQNEPGSNLEKNHD